VSHCGEEGSSRPRRSSAPEVFGSAIARELASGGETLRLSSVDEESARRLAAVIGEAAVVAADNRDALQSADAVVLALRFGVLQGVIDELADPLSGKLVVVPSNPVGLDTATSFYATDDDRAGEEVKRLIRTAGFDPVTVGGVEQSGRLEIGGDLHDLVVGAAEGRSLVDVA
jgi:8-hydroxy-5-deazaflavin:NADPH oxidoreductase